MEGGDRPQRSDAARNRARLLEAAAEVFAEHGVEAGVGEIAARAGVGRGTLFRNFPTKQDLVAAVLGARIGAAVASGRRRLEDPDATPDAVFDYIAEVVERQLANRALFEAFADEFLILPVIRQAVDEVVEVLDALLKRARDAGLVRNDVGAVDVMMLTKGLCAASEALLDAPELVERHLDFMRAAISPRGVEVTLRGPVPTLADLESPVSLPPAAAPAPSA